MTQNAAFAEVVYKAAKASKRYIESYASKKVALVLNNALAHHRIEMLFPAHDDAVLLSLAPYSSMCKLIEGCFSVLKASIKHYLRPYEEEMSMPRGSGSEQERRMPTLFRAAEHAMSDTTLRVVHSNSRHAESAVKAAH